MQQNLNLKLKFLKMKNVGWPTLVLRGSIRRKKNFISLIFINYEIWNPLKCKIFKSSKIN